MVEAIHLQLVLATFAGWATRQQAQLVSYPIEENRVLKEQLVGRGATNTVRASIPAPDMSVRRTLCALEQVVSVP